MVDRDKNEDWARFQDYLKKREQRKERAKETRAALRQKWSTLSTEDLVSELRRQEPRIDWIPEHHPNGMDGAQRVDIASSSDLLDRVVFVEIERGKAHAIDNVVKVWRYVALNSLTKPVLLIQLFSHYFYAKIGTRRRMQEAIFIGEQAERATDSKLWYRHLGKEYWPSTRGGDLDGLVREMLRLVEGGKASGGT